MGDARKRGVSAMRELLLALTLVQVIGCSNVEKRARSDETKAIPAPARFVPIDSVRVHELLGEFTRAVFLSEDTFAVVGAPDEPLCLVGVKGGPYRCVAVRGGGPGEVNSLEQIAYWPASSLAIWDRQTGRLGVWNSSGRPDSSLSVIQPSPEGYDLLGIAADSVIFLGKSPAFFDMPLGTFSLPIEIIAVKGENLRSQPLNHVDGSWISVVEVNGGRSGYSFPSSPEAFGVVTRRGIRVVDARLCAISSAQSRSVSLPPWLCPQRKGFRSRLLQRLDSSKLSTAATHQALARKSDIPDLFTEVIDVIAHWASDELALRRRGKSRTDSTDWVIVDHDDKMTAVLRVPPAYQLISFSSQYWVAARRESDDGADATTVVIARRE